MDCRKSCGKVGIQPATRPAASSARLEERILISVGTNRMGPGTKDRICGGGAIRPFADYSSVVREIRVAGVLNGFDEPDYTRDGCAVRGQFFGYFSSVPSTGALCMKCLGCRA